MKVVGCHRACGGFALLAVLLVLLALFVLAVPFLWSAGEADRAAVRASDRSFLKLSLDDAARYARSRLWESQATFDRTRDFDSLEEIDVKPDLDPEFYSGGGGDHLPWDHQVLDLAAKIDWNSASAHLVANAIGQAGYLLKPLGAEDESLELAGAAGFPELGFVFCDREILRVEREPGTNVVRILERGVGSEEGDCGPSLAEPHSAGAPVLGMDAVAFCLWRASRGEDEIRAFDTGSLRGELAAFLPSGISSTEPDADGGEEPVGPAPLEALLESLNARGTLWGGVGAGPRWQRPVRIEQALLGGNSCVLSLGEWRWFAAGSTVLIEGGGNREFGFVVEATQGRVRLLNAVVNDYGQAEAQISVLSRRPINANTAELPTLVALFENLKLRGRNERVTRSEAEQFAQACLDARPFTGFEDWLDRVLLPAGGLEPEREEGDTRTGSTSNGGARFGEAGSDAYLEREDVIALYANAHGSGDAALEFATAPLAFSSRDVYELDLRAVRRSPNGLERASGRIEQVEVVMPPTELLALWERQVDFEENQRLFGRMPGWLSGPESVFVPDLDGGAASPPRRRAHLRISENVAVGEALNVFSQFPALTELGYFQPAPRRLDEAGQRAGRAIHFDRSQTSLEGENLGQATLALEPTDARLGWLGAEGLARPMALSMWTRMAAGAEGTLVDAGSAIAGDRLHVRATGGQLEVRVHDGPGDHPETAFEEVGQASFPLDGAGGGPAPDQWFNLSLDVRGNRPDQIGVRVDGFAHTGAGAAMRVERRGLTHLTSGLANGETQIAVESTEGFPERCVLRIGDELIEAVRGANSFDATPILTGEAAGFGGRLAREHHTEGGTFNQGLIKNSDYPAGTPVALYGYSLALQSPLPGSGSSLQSDLGPYAVARVTGVNGSDGSPILLQGQEGDEFLLGRGFDPAETSVQTLEVQHADVGSGGSPAQALEAFSSSGGYALLVQRFVTFTVPPSAGVNAQEVTEPQTVRGTRLFGLSVVRYTGKSSQAIEIAEVAVGPGELPNLSGAYPAGAQVALGAIDEAKAFIIEFDDSVNFGAGGPGSGSGLFLVPISIPVPGNDESFLVPEFDDQGSGFSEFAQITRVDQAELTEWVRYDFVSGQFLVRDHQRARIAAYGALTGGGLRRVTLQPGPGQGAPGGGTPGGGIPGGGPPSGGSAAALGPPEPTPPPGEFLSATPNPSGASAPALNSSAANSRGQTQLGFWNPNLGLGLEPVWPISQAVSDALHHRGVFGTASHSHPEGTAVLPVIRCDLPQAEVRGVRPDRGWPGRFDPVFAVEGVSSDPGFPAVVQRAYRPIDRQVDGWVPGADGTPALVEEPGIVSEDQNDLILGNAFYVAFTEQVGVPLGAGSSGDPREARNHARLSKFPSGELPRELTQVLVGASAEGGGGLLNATVDELFFGSAEFGGPALGSTGGLGAAMVLAEDFAMGEESLSVIPDLLRTAQEVAALSPANSFLTQLPDDAGLLRIGEELVLYSGVDTSTGRFEVAPLGRGAFASESRPHAAGESVWFLFDVEVSQLISGATATDNELMLEDPSGFAQDGTVLIEDELLHHTYRIGSSLGMPRTSTEPGLGDYEGAGMLRGRFGSTPAAHAQGAIVVRFPVRYPDLFTPLADAPELAYGECVLATAGSFVDRVFFEFQPAPSGLCELVCLVRSDPELPWDSMPNDVPGLRRVTLANPASGGLAIEQQTDQVELRFFARYLPGAFDARFGLAHGWKEIPRVDRAGVSYFAPGRVLTRRVY